MRDLNLAAWNGRERECGSWPRSAGDRSRCDLTCMKDFLGFIYFYLTAGGSVCAARALGGRAGAWVAMRYSWYAPVSPMKRFTVIRL